MLENDSTLLLFLFHVSCIVNVTENQRNWSKLDYWQSWVVFKHYSAAYFDYVIGFKALYRTSIKGKAHTHSIDFWTLDKSV